MTDKPKMPEPGINTASHANIRIRGYTREQMEAYAEAIEEWAYSQGHTEGLREAERYSHD
jgi:hypothetical protein